MSQPVNRPPGAGAGDAPLDAFSLCHVGILSHLEAFGQLPALLEQAARARHIAADTLKFFREAVFEHHSEEERELFPAVLASAVAGEERDRVQTIVDRLTKEHREVESVWSKLEPGLKDVAKGHDAALDGAAVTALVIAYEGHARYEEQVFLPLSQAILSRNSNHMAALGVSLHLRHVMPEVLARYGHRI
jgi:hypothetical protein